MCINLYTLPKRSIETHFSFFYCAHPNVNFLMKFWGDLYSVMIFLLHFTKWNLLMNGAGTAPLNLALIFKMLLFPVLVEARRTENYFRYGWDELTKHNQSHTNGSMNFVCPLWRRSNILITCAQTSVKSQMKWPELNSFHALGKIMNRNHN